MLTQDIKSIHATDPSPTLGRTGAQKENIMRQPNGMDQVYDALAWPREAHLYFYGQGLYTVEFNGQARPTPLDKVLDFAEQAAKQGIRIVVNMRYRGRNSADLALAEALSARFVEHTIEE